VANVFKPELESIEGPPGYVGRGAEIGRQAGSQRLGASLYEVPPGNSVSPLSLACRQRGDADRAERDAHPAYAGGRAELAEGEAVAFPIGEQGRTR